MPSLLDSELFIPLANKVAEHGIEYFIETNANGDPTGLECAARLGLKPFVRTPTEEQAFAFLKRFPDANVWSETTVAVPDPAVIFLRDTCARINGPAFFWMDPDSPTYNEELAVIENASGARDDWFFESKPAKQIVAPSMAVKSMEVTLEPPTPIRRKKSELDLTPYMKKIFSQFGEDGITLEMVRRLNPTPFFVELGAGDGSENLTRVLAEHLNWDGVWIDAQPNFIHTLRTTANNMRGKVAAGWWQLSTEHVMRAFEYYHVPKDFGVLSIDIDGNDYYLWKALAWYRPMIVWIEAQIQRSFDEPFVQPYDPRYIWDGMDYDSGASVASLVELGRELGYTFVGKCPDPHSPNLLFVLDSAL